jgi:hypothetical protein
MASDEKKTSKKPADQVGLPKLPNGDSIRLGKETDGLKNGALGAGVVALGAAALLGGGVFGKQFQHSYLIAYMWGLSIAVGAVWWIAIQHLFAARWSVVVRRVGELLAQLVLIMAVLSLPLLAPIFMGNDVLYPWAEHHYFEHHAYLAGKASWFKPGFFAGRMVFYFGFWALLATYYLGQSRRQDSTSGDVALTKRLQSVSAPGMILFAISLTFCAIDFLMTLDPVWFSTIFGVYYFATCVLTFNSALALSLMWLQSRGHLKASVTAEHYHDIGKLMFAFICFWTYIGFSQFMLIWYANIPEETHWFADRFFGSWLNATYLLSVAHFFIPFFGMMSRWMKRNTAPLRFWALYILAVCWFDMYWLVAPNLHKQGIVLTASDFLAWAGVAGILIGFALLRARDVNLVPTGDPRLSRSLAFENI